MRIDVLSLFPEMFEPVLNASIVGRARSSGRVEFNLVNIRDYAENKHDKVDDRPFGGGPGMVMMCQPVWDAVTATEAMDERRTRRIVLSPQGRVLTQAMLEDLATDQRLLLIAGHYEGLDERVMTRLEAEEISLGDYVLSGGELAAMVLIDGIVRLLPGVLGHEESALQDSFGCRAQAGRRMLDCSHYTRPRVWEGMEVPDVLLSGDHQAIEDWRNEDRLNRTKIRRPDLLEQDGLTEE